MINSQGKPYCWCQYQEVYGHINFSSNLNETLSPVSSAPRRVCLCDSDGKPQCANLSQIFVNVSVYRGETFSLLAHVIGYDFGTTVGIVHAGFLNSNSDSQLGQQNYNQSISSSDVCTALDYTVFTVREIELLQLQSFNILSACTHHSNGC